MRRDYRQARRKCLMSVLADLPKSRPSRPPGSGQHRALFVSRAPSAHTRPLSGRTIAHRMAVKTAAPLDSGPDGKHSIHLANPRGLRRRSSGRRVFCRFGLGVTSAVGLLGAVRGAGTGNSNSAKCTAAEISADASSADHARGARRTRRPQGRRQRL